MDGVKKFSEAVDKFFSDVSEMIDSDTIIQKNVKIDEYTVKKTIVDIDRAKEIADLIYKVSQSIKIMKDETKKTAKEKKAEESESKMSAVDRWANKEQN